MGDRANVLVKSRGTGQVHLYTHWKGTELPETVYRALKRRLRWDDPQYLARIIFCEMLKDDIEDVIAGETGFGISQRVGDGDDRIVEVDCDAQTVKIGRKKWKFSNFVELLPEDIAWEEG